ncbi:alpha-amylase, partial [Streptomyces sp. SID5914]
ATWVLSNHDVVRHATRLVLPPDTDTDAWLLSGGHAPAVDPAAGLRRARAATLLMLALPGSAYLYQGEELGLPE